MIIMIVITIMIIIIVIIIIVIATSYHHHKGCWEKPRLLQKTAPGIGRTHSTGEKNMMVIFMMIIHCDGSDAMKNHTQIRPKKSTTVERKWTSLISMINVQPQGVELGRRLGESGGATTIQKLAVQMLSNQVNHHHPHHHNHHRNQTLIPPAWQHLAVLHIHFQDAGFSIQLLPFCE